MVNVPFSPPGINPGRPDRGASTRAGTGDPHKLEGRERRAWEESIFVNAGLKGSRLHLARVLLDEFAWGKCWAYPGDELLARNVGVGTATISRALRDLVKLEVIRIAKARGRRWLVFPSHPHAAAFLAELGVDAEPAEVPTPIEPGPVAPPADHPVEPTDHPVEPSPQDDRPADQNDRRSVVVKPGDEARHELAPACEVEPELFLSGLNELTTEGDPPMPAPSPRPVAQTHRRLRGIPDLAGAPVDDPIIAAELARRNRSTEAAAPMSREERAELQAEVLDEDVRDREGRSDAGEAGPPPVAAADGRRGGCGDDPGRATGAAAEAATIQALSKLGPGATRGEVLAATLRLTALFGDPKSRAFYRSVCNDVARGQLPARLPIAAVGSARGPGVRNPGAAFTAHLKRCRVAAESRRPMRT